MTLQKCPCSNPQDLWICHLTRQKGFAEKFKVISLEDYPGLYMRADVITGGLRSGGSSPARSEGNVTMEAKSGKYCVTGCENEEREPWAKECGCPRRAGKDKETVSPLKPPEENIALETLDLSQVRPCQISDLENCKARKLCCFKSLFVVICYSNRKLRQISKLWLEFLRNL